jgi:hypothetical protein
MILSITVWHHHFNWGDSGVIDADLEALVLNGVDGEKPTGWIRDVYAPRWFGPGEYEQLMLMLAADLLLPGLGLAFSGGTTRG